MKILISGANGDIAISILKIIKKNFKKKIRIDGSENKIEGKGKYYFNKIIEVPAGNKKKFLPKSLSIYKKYDLIIPTTEAEIRVISKNKLYYKNINFLINDEKIINLFLDKFKTYKYLKKNKIGELNFCKSLKDYPIKKFPVFLKTKIGSGNKNYFIIKNKNQLNKLNIKNRKDYIYQEFINTKKEYTACIYKYDNFQNIIIFERVLDKDVTFFAKTINNKKMKNILEKLVKKLNFKGSINVQFKMLKNNMKIFEINPRLSSTVLMRDMIGFKDCYWWINDILKTKYNIRKYVFKKSIKIIRDENIKIYE